MTAKTIYLHALTAVHSGTGQTAAIIDLPIAREKTTGWPVLPASSLKGVLRSAGGADSEALFGSPDEASALCFGDQRLLCLPVRSYYGTFAYVTSPLVLQRLHRDMTALGIEPPFLVPPAVEDTDKSLGIRVTEKSKLTNGSAVYLEDLDLAAKPDGAAEQIAAALAAILFADAPEAFTDRFAMVSDAVFDFLSETATEVTARIQLGPNKTTTEGGNLWYEEAVPAEAIFCGPVLIQPYGNPEQREKRFREAEALLQARNNTTIQIGGNSSVGRGLCRVMVA